MRAHRARIMVAFLGIVTAVGCGSGGVGTEGDVVGGPCSEGDCAGGSSCLVATMYPGGTCTVDCTTQADCPDGTVCVQESGGTCLLACDSADDCRDGYGCIEKSTEPDGHALVCIR
jgi:hypothetical protein